MKFFAKILKTSRFFRYFSGGIISDFIEKKEPKNWKRANDFTAKLRKMIHFRKFCRDHIFTILEIATRGIGSEKFHCDWILKMFENRENGIDPEKFHCDRIFKMFEIAQNRRICDYFAVAFFVFGDF